MSQITIGGTTLNFKDSAFTGDQWEQVASWVLNGGAEGIDANAKIATEKAAAASASAATARNSATSAGESANAAANSAASALTSAKAAASSATAAKASKDAAAGSATNASASATSAGKSASAASEKASDAASSASAAATSAQTAQSEASAASAAAEAASGSASQAQASAASAAKSAASVDGINKTAQSWAVGGTGTREGEDTSNAKYWAEQAQQAVGGVVSFNGRAGSVVPQAGDYDKGMVGLGNVDNTSDVNKPVSTKQQAALNGKQAKITANGLLKGDGAGGVTTATKGTDYAGASETVTATLLAASWTGDAAPYSYTLTVSGVTATSNQEVLPALNITAEQLEALQGANIQDGGQAANSMTLKAYSDKPTIDLPIRVIKRGD